MTKYIILHIEIFDMAQQPNMRPQDIVLLLKIVSDDLKNWNQKDMAQALKMSQSEVSQSVSRSKYAGLLDSTGKKVMRLALMEFLQYGLAYVFPQKPGGIVRGIPTAHTAYPLNAILISEEPYVWPYGKGQTRGQSIVPLYASVVDAVQHDPKLHELLALVDALRVGRARDKEIAIKELKKRILDA